MMTTHRPRTYEVMMAETIFYQGFSGDEVNAYLARPLGPGPFPGVVVIHHMPGWDEGSKEITRTFASRGYAAICPNLYYREGPDMSPTDAAAAAREAGPVPDDRCIGDIGGARKVLLQVGSASGKVGVIGYCSGGRQAYICACQLPFDAAVDCYGGRVVASADSLTERQPVLPLDMTPNLGCPVLGLFGAEDKNPSPADTEVLRQRLEEHAKTYEFHTLDGAGHAFFAVDRPNYRVEAAQAGWKLVFDFFDRYLAA